MMHTMTSSLRERALEDTYSLARAVAAERGVTRLTDTTWLDDIGIPVYASIRPNAHRRSLCVHNGKGSRPMEAKVGALMEAIEFSFAESGKNHLASESINVETFLCQEGVNFSWLDLCPLFHAPTPALDDPIPVVEAERLSDGKAHLVPAELVFHPLGKADSGKRFFGTSTNGLASGNTVDEATLHGLLEVIERDIRSYNFIENSSIPVLFDESAPEPVRSMIEKIEGAGYELRVRYTPNRFGLPFFDAYLLEPNPESPIAVSVGTGVHLDASIAAVRAISESAQSRLTHIHGGRDDLVKIHEHFTEIGPGEKRREIGILRQQIRDTEAPVPFSEITSLVPLESSVPGALQSLLARLWAAGFTDIYRTVLSTPEDPISVVRVIVPGMEFYKPDFRRVGQGLMNAITRTTQGSTK